MSTGASREAPVDNECLGKCRQVGGKSTTTGNPEIQAIGSWARQVEASLGKSRQVGGDGTCQQVLHAKHLLTVSVEASVGKSAAAGNPGT